jgi:predicted phosphohydrolase
MIWSISDLHLSLARPKPMDVFGAHWKDHPQRIEAAWRARIAADDWVLIGGDISWAMKMPEALIDLRWIDALPGHKVIIRGNHDYWCPRRPNAVRAQLPPSINLINGDALDIGPAVVCGTRGWVTPDTFGFDANKDTTIYQRELGLLDRALAHAHELAGTERPIIVMIHYPPFVNQQPSEFALRIAVSGAKACIYGHLHRRVDWESAVQGSIEGVFYQLTACDYLGFGPVAVRGL